MNSRATLLAGVIAVLVLIRGKGVEPDVGVNGGSYGGPRPTVLRFDEAGRFLAWTPPGPVKTFAASLTHRGLLLCRSRFYPKTPYQAAAFTSLSPLPTPLEVQLDLPGTTEAVQQVFEEVPLALCRYATRLPDGGAVVAMMERDGGRLVRFDRQWRVDWSFTNHFELRPLFFRISLAADSQSGVFLIGGFASLNGKPFTGIARVLPSGATDPQFYAQISLDRNLTLAALAVQKDGRVLIGGAFTEVNGTKCTSFARLNPDGSLDQEFRTRPGLVCSQSQARREAAFVSIGFSTCRKDKGLPFAKQIQALGAVLRRFEKREPRDPVFSGFWTVESQWGHI